ncbi:hypothetical protein [Xanthomonas arboricola]|uniref:hypothetical protein n=1 Tax=Xanthomonas arboricola TaxID=56448 RepID=UPI00141A6D4D|nr:hypothetical protein [Xanthomonas arboricola]NIK50310.1 hypothetical protein [Xanthomonas arboricola]
MSTETTCTCPSGDGSLRWPCPAHQPSLITSAGAATAVQPLLASDLVFGHPRELFRVTPAGDIVVSEGVSTTDAVRGFWDAVAQARPRPDAAVLNQPSGNSRQLQQPGAAAGLNEPFGDSEQLARPDAASGGDAHDIEDPCDVITHAAQKLAAAGQPRLADRLVRACDAVEQLQASARDARQPVGVEPAAFVPVHPTFGPMWSDTFPAGHCNDGRSRASERRPLYFAPPAQADRMAIKMLVAAGFVSEDKANESLRIAHGFGGDLGQPAPASVPAPDLSRTIAQLNRMRIVLRNARAYVENFTCKSALPPVQQKMIGQIDEVLGALALAWPTAVPVDGLRDAERIDAIAREYWRLDPIEIPTGAGDADVGWRVSQFVMPNRIQFVAEVFVDDPRQAIDAAMRATHPQPAAGDAA